MIRLHKKRCRRRSVHQNLVLTLWTPNSPESQSPPPHIMAVDKMETDYAFVRNMDNEDKEIIAPETKGCHSRRKREENVGRGDVVPDPQEKIADIKLLWGGRTVSLGFVRGGT
ncbi:hypothetical protein L1887_18771 [Cichorium endivia]|nr:hypothetical protein L1887_18771 [Cichorium endivia]